MPFVLDASVTLCWCFQDEHQNLAETVGKMLASSERARVPLIWWFEVRNAVVTGLRRQRVTNEHADKFLHRISIAPIDLAQIPHDQAIFALARRHRLTFYDASYLELAIREGVELATFDRALARAAIAESVTLVGG